MQAQKIFLPQLFEELDRPEENLQGILCWNLFYGKTLSMLSEITDNFLKGFRHKKKGVQKTRLQYIEILFQLKDIYILNFVFTFYVFFSIANLFI